LTLSGALKKLIPSAVVAVELDPAKQIYVFAPADGDDEKIMAPSESVLLRFTHPAQVQVLRLPADAGVRDK
jgi:hypothetical protein